MMNVISENMIVRDFSQLLEGDLGADQIKVLMIYLNGLITEDEASINKLAKNTVDSFNERTMNRKLKKLASNSKDILKKCLKSYQQIPELSIDENGLYILDEHIIRKWGKKIEGLGYFYSSSENKKVKGLSEISVHYYSKKIEYPVTYDIFRKKDELEKYNKEGQFRSKNEIARSLIKETIEINSKCKNWSFDPYFFTKDTAKYLIELGQYYVSRIKRNWKCTFKKKHYSISELYDTLKKDDFQLVKVRHYSTKKVRYFMVAERNVFIERLGNQLVLYVKELKKDEKGNLIEKYEGKYMTLVSNMLDKSHGEIIKIYMMRWRIETGYRDQNQNLSLDKCRWRDIEGQYCFIALVFLAYLLLCWARYKGYLKPYSDNLNTIGSIKESYKKYNNELFADWIIDLKKQCNNCRLLKLVYHLIYNKKINIYQSDLYINSQIT